MNTIGITGGTGFVGQHLVQQLLKQGNKVVIFSRKERNSENSNITYAQWDPSNSSIDQEALATINAMVHLAGEGIADKRWTEERKKAIVSSRVDTTRFLVAALKQYANNCTTFVSASATGYYGPDDAGEPFTENASHHDDFLGNTCKRWEESALTAEGTFRTVIIRIGIVLGKEAGAFKEFVQPMSMGVMPILGSGKQVVSWIHVDDLAGLFAKAVVDSSMKGIYNGVAPNPVAHKTVMKTIACTKGGIKIPIYVPAFILKIMLGGMSVEILKSCTVSSEKTEQIGYEFNYPNIEIAVKHLLGK